MSKKDARKVARRIVEIERRVDGLRTRQLPFSAVSLDDGSDQRMTDGVTVAVDAHDLAVTHDASLTDLTDISDDTAVESTFLPEHLAIADSAADSSFVAAVRGWEKGRDAKAAADQAEASALQAKQTADGRNRIFVQAITPVAPPELPFVQGDMWYETIVVAGKVRINSINIRNATGWVPYNLVANSLLVPGSVGSVLIENGAITGPKLSVDALNFKTAEGMSLTAATITSPLVRTAAAGRRMEFNASGIQAFDSAGSLQSSLTPNEGGFSVTGGFQLTSQPDSSGNRSYAWLYPTGLTVQHRPSGVSAWARTSPGDITVSAPNDTTSAATQRNPSGTARLQAGGGYAHSGTQGAGAVGLVINPSGPDGSSSMSVTGYAKDSRSGAQSPGGYLSLTAFSPADIRMAVIGGSSGRIVVSAPDGVVLSNPSAMEDTDWVNLAHAGIAGSAQWCRILGIIWFQFDITLASNLAPGAAINQLTNLPLVARPVGNTPISSQAHGSYDAQTYVEYSSGDCAVRNTDSTARNRFKGAGQWPARRS